MAVGPANAMLSYSADGNSYTDLTEILELSFPEVKLEVGKTTHLGSTSQYNTYLAGWRESGTGKFTLLFDKTVMGTLQGFLDDGVMRYWRCRLNDGTTGTSGSKMVCQGILTAAMPGAAKVNESDPIEITCEIKFSGKPTYTAAT